MYSKHRMQIKSFQYFQIVVLVTLDVLIHTRRIPVGCFAVEPQLTHPSSGGNQGENNLKPKHKLRANSSTLYTRIDITYMLGIYLKKRKGMLNRDFVGLIEIVKQLRRQETF